MATKFGLGVALAGAGAAIGSWLNSKGINIFRSEEAADASAEGGQITPAPDFVVSPNGDAVPVPDGAVGPIPTRSPGVQYVGGSGGKGMSERTTGVRIMGGNKSQGRRVNYMNEQSQTVDPKTGRTISNSDPRGHRPLP